MTETTPNESPPSQPSDPEAKTTSTTTSRSDVTLFFLGKDGKVLDADVIRHSKWKHWLNELQIEQDGQVINVPFEAIYQSITAMYGIKNG